MSNELTKAIEATRRLVELQKRDTPELFLAAAVRNYPAADVLRLLERLESNQEEESDAVD